jgi:hypothetical protein
MDRTSELAFWATTAADYLRPLFAAAILTGGGAQNVAAWIGGDNFATAEEILRAHGLNTHANRLADFRTEPPKAKTSIKTTMLATVSQ